MLEILYEFSQNSYFARILLAGLLGAIIGLEREFARRDPSLKTFTVICIASCIFGILGEHFSYTSNSDPSRIAGQVATGIGFLGAGVIFKHDSKVLGLTSAALVWLAAAVGVAIGSGMIYLALEGTIVTILLISIFRILHFSISSASKRESRNT